MWRCAARATSCVRMFQLWCIASLVLVLYISLMGSYREVSIFTCKQRNYQDIWTWGSQHNSLLVLVEDGMIVKHLLPRSGGWRVYFGFQWSFNFRSRLVESERGVRYGDWLTRRCLGTFVYIGQLFSCYGSAEWPASSVSHPFCVVVIALVSSISA